MPRREAVDAVCVLRQHSEKSRVKNKKLFFIFVDLEKSFDRVSREIIRFTLRWKGVSEVNGIVSL